MTVTVTVTVNLPMNAGLIYYHRLTSHGEIRNTNGAHDDVDYKERFITSTVPATIGVCSVSVNSLVELNKSVRFGDTI